MVMVSMCLAGVKCRYDGGTKSSRLFDDLKQAGEEIELFCPECMGGLSIPRDPAEIVGGTGEDVLDGRAMIRDKGGKDVTEQFLKGAYAALALAEKLHPTSIYMKTRSPSCGSGEIYNGTFSGTLTGGDGVTAALLKRHGYNVIAAE